MTLLEKIRAMDAAAEEFMAQLAKLMVMEALFTCTYCGERHHNIPDEWRDRP